ncbi:MAG: DUF1097 domain-containing protein [Coriobacteriales bacterium]|nr:DUF1097 domain-containing protein [Coriobacteriales bacterium]
MIKNPKLALAISIGLLPPIWAVVSGHLGITCGAVALICAGIYVTAGNKVELGLPMSLGFLLSDLMAVAAVWLMENMPFPADVNTFLTLAVLGFLAVLLCTTFDKVFFLPAVLSGWAVGLTVMGPLGFANLGTMPIQVGVAMLAGVWYAGWFVDVFSRLIGPKQ